MDPDTNRRTYPYSKNRVLFSAIIAIISTVLALPLIMYDIVLVLYYLLTTFAFVIVTYFVKRRLYTVLTTGINAENESETKHSSWRTLLIAFFMLLGFIAIPMLMAGVLSGPVWFIMITGFMTGVSISEIVLYVQARDITG